MSVTNPQSRSHIRVYSPELEEKLINLLSQGFTISESSRMIGVHPQTLYKWMEADLDFMSRINVARFMRLKPLIVKLEYLLNSETGSTLLKTIHELMNRYSQMLPGEDSPNAEELTNAITQLGEHLMDLKYDIKVSQK